MKRLISIVLILIFTFSIFSIVDVNAEEKSFKNEILYGDAYVDNDVNIIDATIIQQYLLDLVDDSMINVNNADVSGDDDLDIMDASIIQKRLANLIPIFPAEMKAKTITETIYYDDYFDMSEKYSEYTIMKMYGEEIKSYKVEKGKKTDRYDDKLLEKSDDNLYHAIATGSVSMDLVPDYAVEDYEKNGNLAKGVKILNLFVLPAKLTTVYITGQSNAFGHVSDNFLTIDDEGWELGPVQDSVVCDKGQVYSTVIPFSDRRGIEVTSNVLFKECTFDNYLDYVPENLISNRSCSSKELVYPIYSLTSQGNGKTGVDSAFAYQYNKLSDEKVWTINTAVGGTSVTQWQSDSKYYKMSKLIYEKCNEIKKEEFKANHYTESKNIVLWMQGETDRDKEFDMYYDYFMNIINNYDSFLNFDIFSMIITRSSTIGGHNTGHKDMYLTAPRLVQNYLSISTEFPEISLSSRVHEYWNTNENVEQYFISKYPSGLLDYPLRENSNFIDKLPITLSDVHDDIHFGQAGHNENGFDAATNTYNRLNGIEEKPNFQFMDSYGNFIVSDYYADSDTFKLSPRFDIPINGDDLEYKYDDSLISYDEKYQTFTYIEKEETNVSVYYKNELIGSVDIHPFIPHVKSYEYDGTLGYLTLKIDPIEGVSRYRVLYRRSDNETFTDLGLVDGTTYVDSNFTSGVTYIYTVTAEDEFGNSISYYDTEGVTFIAP